MALIKDKNLYYVGGVVRDELLGVESLDVDYCYEGNALEFSKGLNVIKTNPDFGTVRVLTDEGEIDIASTRAETYPRAGHLPIVDKIGCSLKEDLKRRDFTINALAKNTLSNEIIDYFAGLEDLKNKELCVLHDSSFIDDPSRIIRGLKFRVRFSFKLSEHTKILQDSYIDNINYDMSYHRLKKELKETFDLNKEIALRIFIEEQIYKLLGKNQEVPNYTAGIEELVARYNPKLVWLVYMGLFDLSNFELTNEEKNILEGFYSIKKKMFSSDLEVYKAFEGLPLESLLLYAITTDVSAVIDYLERISKIKISLTGNDLLGLGIPSGEVYKEIFDYVLEKKFYNLDSTLEDEIAWVKEKFVEKYSL